jgi:hypothetical protein
MTTSVKKTHSEPATTGKNKVFRVLYGEKHVYEKLITARSAFDAEGKGQREVDKLTAANRMEDGDWREVNIPQNVSISADEVIVYPKTQTQSVDTVQTRAARRDSADTDRAKDARRTERERSRGFGQPIQRGGQ